MEAYTGIIGTILGAVIAGVFVFFKDKQQNDFTRIKTKKELLLVKYELIYKELLEYSAFASDISVQMISETGYARKFNIEKVRSIEDNHLKMNVSFYAPELTEIFNEIEKKHTVIARAMSEFIIKHDATKDHKEKLTGEAFIALTEMSTAANKAQEQLAELVSKQVNA